MVRVTISKFRRDFSNDPSVISEKYSSLKPLILGSCNVTGTNFFSTFSENVSQLYENILETEVDFTVVNSGYVKGVLPILARIFYGRKFHYL